MTCHYIAGTITYQYYIYTCLIKQFSKRKIISRDHGYLLAGCFHLLQRMGCNAFYFFVDGQGSEKLIMNN